MNITNAGNGTNLLLIQDTLVALIEEVHLLQDQIDQQHLELKSSEEARLNFWLLIAATNILFMQAGFALLEVGTVQAKNAKSILFKNIVDCCTGILIWWIFGYGVSQQGFLGRDTHYYGDVHSSEAVYFFHSFTYSTTCATIISGGVAERISFSAYMGIAGFMVGFFYPLMAFWCWSGDGWLYQLGYTDFAGSGVIHALGGIATLMSAWQLGPRIGRFRVSDEEQGKIEVHEFKGHSPVLSALGTFILLFGWFSFNASSTLGANMSHFYLSSRAAVNTMLAAASASCTGILWRQKETGVHDLDAVNNTLLCGAVAITGCCAYVDFWVSPIIGALSTIGYYLASSLTMSFKIDDPLDAFAVHGGGGLWGVLATALFVNPKYVDEGRPFGLLFGGGGHLLGAQLLGILIMVLWGAVGFGIIIHLLNQVPGFGLRADKDAELLGLDFAYHDGFAYPDFNKQNILTFNEMKAAEKRVEARNKGKKQNVRKVADLTTNIKKRNKRKQNTDGTSYSGSCNSDSVSTNLSKKESITNTQTYRDSEITGNTTILDFGDSTESPMTASQATFKSQSNSYERSSSSQSHSKEIPSSGDQSSLPKLRKNMVIEAPNHEQASKEEENSAPSFVQNPLPDSNTLISPPDSPTDEPANLLQSPWSRRKSTDLGDGSPQQMPPFLAPIIERKHTTSNLHQDSSGNG
mmetsp:Transcript_20058/g.26492  ORF Transcript_20058/g.26492 Transcript_20058/m.26492 type:complete len:691 (+) Transcript_20058:133-2205(+)